MFPRSKQTLPLCGYVRMHVYYVYVCVFSEGGISPCSLLLGLIYIRRLVQTNQEYLSTVSSRDLFLIAMVSPTHVGRVVCVYACVRVCM